MQWPFEDSGSTVAVTSSEVAEGALPVVYVSREADDEGEITWQFHNDPERFDFASALLVRIDTMVLIDSTISDLSDIPVGWKAVRASKVDEWQRSLIR